MFHIIIKETKEFLRDKINLFFLILFPISLIYLLGNLLANMDHAEEAIGTIKIQYQLETQDPYQRMMVQNFILTAGESNDNLLFEEIQDPENARTLAGKDEINAVVIFTGDPMRIQIYEGKNQIKNKAINAIFQSFIQTDKAVSTVLEVKPEVLNELPAGHKDYIEQKDLGIHRTMIDYYAVTMVAMVCFMSILTGAGAFLGERQNKTINRLIIAPKSRVSLFLQKILGMIPQVILQILIIMFASVILFKANYAANWKDNLYLFLMFFLVTLCMVSLGAVIGLVLKAHPMAVIMPVLWTMMFFGGTYSRNMRIDGITEAMPIYQIQQAAYELAIFGRYGKASQVIVICFVVMAAALITGAFLFSYKQEER